MNVPGLKIAVPGSPADAYSLLLGSVADEDPVLYFEHKGMLNHKGELPEDRGPVSLGQAATVRSGSDVTVVATQLMRVRAEEAADTLAGEGIEIDLIDPRTLVPFDFETVRESFERTGRLVVVQESPEPGSWGQGVIATVVAECFDSLDGPPLLISGDNTPVPYAGPLEQAWLPSAERIAEAIRTLP